MIIFVIGNNLVISYIDFEIASDTDVQVSILTLLCTLSSTSLAILHISFTLNTGYLPIAVSALNIMTSLPSRIALATSLVSALVGVECSIMDCSIWVAVITSLPSWLHFLIISFCIKGIF